MTILRSFFVLALLALPQMAPAQDRTQTLADIRQELSVLYVDIQRLKTELSTTGGATGAGTSASALERLGAIESELQRLTSATEELEFRVNRVIRDGTNRIGDLEFRLCELEDGCDIGALGETPSLGGVDAEPDTPAADPATATGNPSLAIGEEDDFARAGEALASGDFRRAADLFAAHTETYPGGPLSTRAHIGRGQAFEGLGEMTNAARAYLDAFSGAPEGPEAATALTSLGKALGAIGQVQDACTTLGEVSVRFPDAPQVAEAAQAMQGFGCS